MPIERLPEWKPVIGDNNPRVSYNYRDVPQGFRFTDLTPLTGATLTAQYWERLTGFADSYYRNHEIVGQTFVDFFENLQDSYYLNADTLEKALEVYNDDIAKPTQSRVISRTHEETETLPNSETERSTQYGHQIATTDSGNDDTETIEYGIEGTDTTPSERVEVDSSRTGSENHSGTDTETESVTGGTRQFNSSDTEEWSDVGVAPNYQLMNGFLDNNRTMERIFIGFFEDCFTLNEYYYW